MWRQIAKEWDGTIKVGYLKKKWLKENGFDTRSLTAGCFFCDYTKHGIGCEACPGRLVDFDFNCEDNAYHFFRRPVEFYRELLRLNKIRKNKK